MKRLISFEKYSSLKVSLDGKTKMKIDLDQEVLGGKFKNKKIKVKKIGINAKGDIAINDKPFSKFRTNENELFKESYNIKSSTGNKVVAYFETGQGSKYLITDKGETKRWKSVHSNTGEDDKGLKDWYQHSFFVNSKYQYEANSVQFLIDKGFKCALNVKNNKCTIYVVDNNKWRVANFKDAYTKSNINRDIIFEIIEKPEIGYNVCEYIFNNDNFSIKKYHFGSEITKILEVDKITDEELKYFKNKNT